MKLGDIARKRLHFLPFFLAALILFTAPQAAVAAIADVVDVADAAVTEEVVDAAVGYAPLGPDMIKGQPVDPNVDFWGGLGLQPQYSDIGHAATGLHIGLVYLMAVICIFVLGLLLWIVIRYNHRRNPVPSKTSHNTLLEVIWTGVPTLILLAVALPSLSLLVKQYESAPEDAVTIKITGYQWYWGYEYPDYEVSEVISNMMPEEEADANDLPRQLAVDNRLVVPVGVPLRLQITAADVIHSFAVPSLWFKLDGVPGRLNEKVMTVTEPGIYYGQCSELCGARHGYMPIAVEAVPLEQFEAWVAQQGGTLPGAEAEEDASADATDDAEADEEAAEVAPAA